MPSDLTPEQREAALATIVRVAWTRLERKSAVSILDALLALGWTPPAQPDAIAAAEARGRREGVEAAVAIAQAERGRRLALSQEPGKSPHNVGGFWAADAILDRIEALSSIPPQEADPT